MKRKVIQIAESTQLISLPRKWAQEHNIKKGEELDVSERGHTLIISTDSAPKTMEKSINVSGLLPRLIDRFLARAYQKGYDKITFYFNTEEQMMAIQRKVPELLGFEIMAHTKNKCTVQSISSTLDIDFDSSLRKAFRIVIEMAEICLDAYTKGDTAALENVEHRDLDVNKFCYFCLRAINKYKLFDGGEATMLYYLIESLEDVGDDYKALGKSLALIKQKNPRFINLLKDLLDMTRKSYDFFYDPKQELAVSIFNMRKEAEATIEKSLLTKDINEVKALLSMKSTVSILYHYPTMRLDTIKEMDVKE